MRQNKIQICLYLVVYLIYISSDDIVKIIQIKNSSYLRKDIHKQKCIKVYKTSLIQ